MREIFRSKSFISFLVLLFIFILYTVALMAFIAPVTALDIKIIIAVKQIFAFLPLSYVVAVTDFGFSSYFIQFLIPLFLVCIYLKKYTTFFVITVGYLLVLPFIQVLKNIIMRDRPDVHLQRIAETEFSYPSGHSLTAFFMGVILIYLTAAYVKNVIARRVLFGIIAIWMFTIPFTRVWLGVHFPTDTLGGALLGSSLACLVITIVNYFDNREK